jgi:hypothetical protein
MLCLKAARTDEDARGDRVERLVPAFGESVAPHLQADGWRFGPFNEVLDQFQSYLARSAYSKTDTSQL